ncbi:MAG: 1-deoxy-D-xylulose-5-phosphate reductoisomerase [Pseudomonadota bacterium]|nr:1-deoxy-D-xylulose-5-phosphate reductoisomerase [Pseudomonadota bacterium]
MNKEIIILGSTGSIGTTTLSVIKEQNFKIILLSTDKNAKKLLNQAILFKVKDVIIEDEVQYKKYKELFNKNKIRIYLGLINLKRILKKKVNYCINSISGIDGLSPTLDVIPFTQNILIANKESIICGWHLIKKKLIKHKVNFIPIDSEHFSIWKLIKNENYTKINKIILTASGGPFLKKTIKEIKNINPIYALKHPNWKMGKKISIDSATMMNKVFEFIEAIKIFDLKKKNLKILIHPKSFVHAIVFYQGSLIKFLAHDPKMSIPIANALDIKNNKIVTSNEDVLMKLNNLNFEKPNIKKFPVLSVINSIPENTSYFETILITINDTLVSKYLNSEINYISIQKNLINIIKNPYFKKYYKLKPKNIYDIKNMIIITKNYLNKNIVYYEK